MVYNCLKDADNFTLDYTEISATRRQVPAGYDFYLLNYHPITMAWLKTSSLRKLLGTVLTIVLEVLPDDPFVLCPDNHFDGYCVLDPSIRLRDKRVFAFPRPLEAAGHLPPYTEGALPVIGTFGFATKGKGFQHVVEAVNKEFEKAIVKINIPYGDFVPQSEAYAYFLGDLCKKTARPGIQVEVTHDYMTKEELIHWCAKNTLNCFLYDRNLPGLAATTDQAISSGRPLSVSRNDTFRHILTYIKPYPEISLRESIAASAGQVRQMQQDWSPERFIQRFEEMLEKLSRQGRKQNPGAAGDTITLPLQKKNLSASIAKRIRKYKRYLSIRKLKRVFQNRKQVNNEELI